MLLDELAAPIVLAPLGGGPSTPQLTAAVCEAGGLGVLAWAYLSADEGARLLRATRAATSRPFGVNVFAPVPGPAPAGAYSAYVERVRSWAAERGGEAGEPRFGDDDWHAKIELLLQDPVPLVTFAFGSPEAEVIARLQAAGSEVWVTVTTPEEALEAARAGADALVVQGAEAGGHRGSFVDRPDLPLYGVLPLLQLLRRELELPLVASGGIVTGAGLASVLAAGARAGQLGSAFMLAPEAGTSEVHRRALRSPAPTALTRAFTGRLARGVVNRFMAENEDAPIAYPEIHHVTAPLRRVAREQGDPDAVNLWAGEAHQLALELPAGEIVRRLQAEMSEAIEALALAHRPRRSAAP